MDVIMPSLAALRAYVRWSARNMGPSCPDFPGHSRSLEPTRIDRPPVMWSETVGLGTRPVWDQKKIGLGLRLASLVLFCEARSCHARRHNDLEGHSNFSSTIYSFSILCLEHHYCGDQQWRSLYLKVKSAKCLCLLPVVLVLVWRIWSCLHYCRTLWLHVSVPVIMNLPRTVSETNGDFGRKSQILPTHVYLTLTLLKKVPIGIFW